MSRSAPVRHTRPDNQPVAETLLLAASAMLVGLASLLVTLGDVALPGRAALAVAAMVCVPGIPIAVAARWGPVEVQIVLGVALSLACWLLTAQAQLQTGAWSPFVAQAGLTAVGVAATLVVVGTRWNEQ